MLGDVHRLEASVPTVGAPYPATLARRTKRRRDRRVAIYSQRDTETIRSLAMTLAELGIDISLGASKNRCADIWWNLLRYTGGTRIEGEPT
jgi:hypothetical protein